MPASISRLLVIILLSGLGASLSIGERTEAALLGEVQKLTAADAGFNDFFGSSVAISYDTVIVGAKWGGEGTIANTTGAAYIFNRAQSGAEPWGEVTRLTASDAEADDEFGWSVAISGDTAIVGAHLEDAGGNDRAGAAYVFRANLTCPHKRYHSLC